MEGSKEKETQSTQSEEEEKMLLIPDDILIEILSRLPSKSLLRLRWTCKYWFDLLIRNHGFIKMHLHRHHHSTTTTSHLLLISRNSTPLKNDVVVSYSMKCSDFIINSNNLSSSPPPETIQLDYCNLPLWIDQHTIRADAETDHYLQFLSMGSCNGLICLHTLCGICYYHVIEFEFLLWNPSTREIKKLPPYKKSNADLGRNGNHLHFSGFGFDHTIDDYKVIYILILYGGGGGGGGDAADVVYPEVNINIYTLGSNSWRKKIITDQLGCLARNNFRCSTNTGCFLNGALHWITRSGILCFDIVEEEEQEQLQPPNYGDRGSSNLLIYMSELEVLNGCLCVINFFEIELHSYDSYVELWMMKDYGVNESWNKLFNIDPRKSDDICGSWYLNGLKPIELCKDSGILMLFNNEYLVLYDLKNEKHIWVHKIDPIKIDCVSESYKESMVSLKSGIYLTDVGSTTSVQKRIGQVEEEEEK